MPKKLAITVSGAVSLGSYEAGVMYEVIRAIGQHNGSLPPGDANRIEIDVLTGASAGGITATICAQKLMFEAASLSGAYGNTLYSPWVADVDIRKLLTGRSGDSDTGAILSSKFVEQLSRRYITDRYESHMDPAREKHAAAAERIWLGLALSNLNGVDYGLPLKPSGQFIYSRFQDELTALIENLPTDDVISYWEPLRNAAVSCGAFPFAFSPVDVIRHAIEYDSQNLVTQLLQSQRFCYTDGGTFQNEPLGLAKNLVDRIDPTHTDTANRFYLFVAPGAKSSSSSASFNAAKADFIPLFRQIAPAIFNQARFQDWITAEDMNEKVELFNSRATGLANLLKGASAVVKQRAKALQAAADELLPQLFAGKVPQVPGTDPVGEARARLKKQFATEYGSLPAATRDVWIDAILTLEEAADMGERDEMKIVSITASDAELAGADLFAFGGFFDFKYRKHDYDVGRDKAQRFLTNACPLGVLKFQAEPIDPIDPSLNNLKLEQMEEQVRKDFYDRLKDRVLTIMEAIGMNYVTREAVYHGFLASRIKQCLKL